MKKRHLIPLGLALAALCAAVIIACGRTYTARLDRTRLPRELTETDEITVEIEETPAPVELTEQRVENGVLVLTFRALEKGETVVRVSVAGETHHYIDLYVHSLGVITCDNYFGDCTGDIVIPIAMLVYLAAVLWVLLLHYRENLQKSLYQYRNVQELGLTVFLGFMVIDVFIQLFNYKGFLRSAESILSVFHFFSGVVLPVAFVLSILITVSNISLMRREGRNWRNMLGTFLGIGLCLLTLFPDALGEYLQWSPNAIVDVHNEKSPWLYIEIFTESFVSAIVTYLECILLGTVILGVKAARHVPAFDKDYMLILGCQIRDDGTLTPLLRSRADRAIEFARTQKEKTGKELVFVPSGGQGPDEVMAEADAIKNYLLTVGVPEGRILSENTSVNTEENIRHSMRLIREHAGKADPKVAFSTTNYHVFRAGLIAQKQGESLEGVGSPTKRYFWLNAFIREFIATLVSERKKHMAVVALITAIIVGMVAVRYFSVVI